MSLNWQILPPSLIRDGDSPRARREDPLTSHAAADRSQASRAHVKLAVLVLVSEQGPVTGNVLNELYLMNAFRPGFQRAHFDSPRKRAGELADDGLLEADRSNGREAVYKLTDAGRTFLAQVKR